jgi:hypothetical protein
MVRKQAFQLVSCEQDQTTKTDAKQGWGEQVHAIAPSSAKGS